MRIAICFRGISYLEHYDRNQDGTMPVFSVDFRDTLENIQANVLQPYKEQGHQVDVFLGTYHSPLEKELVEAYQPVATYFKEAYQHWRGAGWVFVNHFHIQLVELVEQYEREHSFQYDLIIMTRFDLWFLAPLTDYGIHLNKIMLNYEREDNLFFVPRLYLDVFKQVFHVLDQRKECSHELERFLKELGHDIVGYLHLGHPQPGEFEPMFRIGRYALGFVKRDVAGVILEDTLLLPTNCPRNPAYL